jgi:pyruvate kinase
MKVKAAAIVVFTFSGRAARLVAKYKPPMPVLAVVFPREGSDPTKWRSYGTTQVSNMYIYNICLGFTTIFHFVEQNMPTYFTTSMLLSGKAMFCCKRCLPFDGEY